MPISSITQIISAIPNPPHRGVDVQTIFVNKQEDFQDHLTDITVTELNTLKDQFNSRISEINSTATTMNGYANTASAGASTATTKAGEASISASDALSYKNQAETFKNNASTSATKASQWADNNYNVEVETGKYSAKHWSTVAQNATANKIDKVASTDNAIVRFNGTTGDVQNSTIIIDDAGTIIVTSPENSAIIGVELLSNGTFTGSATGWTLGTNWVYSSNTVICTLNASAEGALSQNVNVVSDDYYLLEWYQTNSIDTNGQITPSLGAVVGGEHSSGTTTQMYQQIFRATSTGSVSLSFTVTDITGTGTITIDSVSLKQITPMKPSIVLNNTENSIEKLEFRTTKNVGSIHPNIGIGNGALRNNTTGFRNTAVGGWTLLNNTTGFNNTASGAGALTSNTTGSNNTASGVAALQNNTTGYNNTASGLNALQNNTTGYSNTANGVNALQSNTTGNYNTASGQSALQSNTTGSANTANGVNVLQSNTTGNYNTASGAGALQNNTTGYNNTASGLNALQNNTTGYSNTANGVNALFNNTTYSNVSGFGYNSNVTGSNQVQLGDASTTTYVYGTVGNRSDIRDKADIRDTILGLDFIKSLRPVDYKWDMRDDYKPEKPTIEVPDINDEDYETKKAEYDLIINKWLEDCKFENIVRDGSKKRTRYHQGFIAQEVLELGTEFGGIQDHSIKGGEDVLSIGYDEMIAPLVKAVQELSATNIELQKRIEILEGDS